MPLGGAVWRQRRNHAGAGRAGGCHPGHDIKPAVGCSDPHCDRRKGQIAADVVLPEQPKVIVLSGKLLPPRSIVAGQGMAQPVACQIVGESVSQRRQESVGDGGGWN